MQEDSRRIIVDIKAVAKHYGEGEARVDALRNLDLRVHAGEVVALLGPSGCGKTTTLRIVAGLITQDEGTLAFGDRWTDAHGDRAFDEDDTCSTTPVASASAVKLHWIDSP